MIVSLVLEFIVRNDDFSNYIYMGSFFDILVSMC